MPTVCSYVSNVKESHHKRDHVCESVQVCYDWKFQEDWCKEGMPRTNKAYVPGPGWRVLKSKIVGELMFMCWLNTLILLDVNEIRDKDKRQGFTAQTPYTLPSLRTPLYYVLRLHTCVHVHVISTAMHLYLYRRMGWRSNYWKDRGNCHACKTRTTVNNAWSMSIPQYTHSIL